MPLPWFPLFFHIWVSPPPPPPPPPESFQPLNTASIVNFSTVLSRSDQVYEVLLEDGVYHTETCRRDLVNNIGSKSIMCMWLE